MRYVRWLGFALMVLAGCGEVEAQGKGRVLLDTSGFETSAAFLSCLEGKAAIISAHRGGPASGYPENAIETFENTLRHIPAIIETDVRATRDGVLVLMHDETVDRTTTGSGAIASMTLEEVRSLRLVDQDGRPTNFAVPTLTEALIAMKGKTILQLDVKRGVGLARVVRAVEAARAEPYTAIITYTDNGAFAASEAGRGVSIIAGLDDVAPADANEFVERQLAYFAQEGLGDDRLIVWTGITLEPETAVYQALGERDISTSGGTLGAIDRRAENGERGLYRALEEAGLDIIATDRPVEAASEIGTSDLADAVSNCRSNLS